MKQQTIYFLQALWDIDIQRDMLKQIAKEASLYEIEHSLVGVLNVQTIWVSDVAKSLRIQVNKVKNDIESVSRPYQLFGLAKEYQRLIGEIRALQIKTAKTLNANSGPMFDDIHIIVRQLFPFALKKVQEQTFYQLYRLMILNGEIPVTKVNLPISNMLKDWIDFYKDELLPMLEQLNDQTLDGRWAYERKTVTLNKKIQIEQFVSVKPYHEEIKNGIGKPVAGLGKNGYLRIFGRGYITNLSPWDMISGIDVTHEKNLESLNFIDDENADPINVLDRIFGQEKYIIAPEKYFEVINKYIISNTFYWRIQLGNCMYCDSPLYHNKCPNCG